MKNNEDQEKDVVEKVKNKNAEERLFEDYQFKSLAMNTSGSKLFYSTIVILNIFLLFVAFLVLNGKEKIEKFSVVLENMGGTTVTLIFLMFVAVMVLKVIPDYLKVFSKTKKRKFWACYSANSKCEFFNGVTLNKKGNAKYICHLSDSKIKSQQAVDTALSKKFISKISFCIYSLLFMIIGAFSWVKFIPIWLYLIALLALVVNFAYVCFVFYFGKNKEEAMGVISNICKFLYNKKIIKDYEKLFYKIVDKMIVYNKTFKYSKIIIWTEVFANILIYFLKGLAVYLLCYSINLLEGGILFQLLFVGVVMEGVVMLWPFAKGTLIYEIVFILLFKSYYFAGFIFWAMVIYRIFDYFMYVVNYLITMLIGKIMNKKGTMQT